MSILEIKGLYKTFGGVHALENVGFTIEEKQIVALIGPNGAGKTTMFNMITGVLPLTAGEIIFQGRPLNGLPMHRIAALGVVRTFQNLQVFSNLTVLENVMAGRHMKSRVTLPEAAFRFPWVIREEKDVQARAMEYLELVGLAGKAGEDAGNLPFGQQRLMEIARSAALEPKLLLLDEPAAGLNATESRALVEIIYRLRREGMAILLVEHDMETVMEVADKIVVLDFGVKIAEGTPVEIQRNPKVINAYLGEEVS